MELNRMRAVSFNLAVACSALLAGALPGHSQPLTISTLAGQALPGSADGKGSVARFSHPNGVTIPRSVDSCITSGT